MTRTRLALGFTTKSAFCRELGLRPDHYIVYELGKRVSIGIALRIREKLRIPLDWIYGGDASRLPAALRKELEKRR